MRCPKCGNENCQITTETTSSGKDFSAGKGLPAVHCYWVRSAFYAVHVEKADKSALPHPLGMPRLGKKFKA